jgi:teichuronic acid biosynthesis glycosyltransferase TuaG
LSHALVSVITPVYDSIKYVRRSIESVINQTFHNWEMILVDDGSSDGSLELIKSIAKTENRIKIIQNRENRGSGFSRNKAIKLATGKYIAFLDSDDTWHMDKLKVQIDLMEKNNWSFSHTSYGYISEKGERIKSTFHVSNHPVNYWDLLKKTEISCLTAIYNQKALGKCFMSEHRRKQDYSLWLSILKTGIESYPIDIELAFYRQRPGSATSKKSSLILGHIKFLMETQSMNLIQALYYTSYWMFNGFIRYFIK